MPLLPHALTLTRISSFLKWCMWAKPLRRTYKRLDLVLPFISLRSPSFHHAHLPKVRTPQCSLCQQLPAHVFVSWVFFHVWVRWKAPLFTCDAHHRWLVSLTQSQWREKCQSADFKGSLRGFVCLYCLTALCVWRTANGRTISNRKCWFDFLSFCGLRKTETTNKVKICTQRDYSCAKYKGT